MVMVQAWETIAQITRFRLGLNELGPVSSTGYWHWFCATAIQEENKDAAGEVAGRFLAINRWKSVMKYYSRRFIKPNDLNPGHNLFDGQLLSWIVGTATVGGDTEASPRPFNSFCG